MTLPHAPLAIDGGAPVRRQPLPYARHDITDADAAAVVDALRADWLTGGPRVGAFESALCGVTRAKHAVAVANGTAALHAAYAAVGVGPGDEVIVPPITFVATANAARFLGATPVFADVDAGTLLIDPSSVLARVSPRTRAIVGVDLAGQPADYGALRDIARSCGATLVADACHAIGGADEHGVPVGTLADLSTFSFHPAKHVTTLEGGAVTCASDDLAARMRVFRNHGISTEARDRDGKGAWHYEQHELGHNLRISDVQCALGASQLLRLAENVERRRAIAARYHTAFAELEGIAPLAQRAGVRHAFHLYLVRVQPDVLRRSRDEVLWALRAEGIGATLHYPAVHLQPYYRGLGNAPGTCPNAERAADELITLPLYPSLSDDDVDDVITAVTKVVRAARP